MSKVYEYHQEMEELFADADYQDWLCQQSELQEQDLVEMAKDRCGSCAKNMVTCNPGEDFCQGHSQDSVEAKAEKFAKMMLGKE